MNRLARIQIDILNDGSLLIVDSIGHGRDEEIQFVDGGQHPMFYSVPLRQSEHDPSFNLGFLIVRGHEMLPVLTAAIDKHRELTRT